MVVISRVFFGLREVINVGNMKNIAENVTKYLDVINNLLLSLSLSL